MKALLQQFKSLSLVEIVCHITFWWFMSTLSITADVETDMSFPPYMFQQGIIYGMVMNMVVFYYNYFYLVPQLLGQNVKKYLLFVVLLIIGSSIVEACMDLVYLNMRGASPKLPDEFIALIFVSILVHFTYWLLSMPMRLVRDWFNHLAMQQKIKAEQTQTELAMLKTQVQPHFLFNTLNTLYSSSYEYGDMQTAEGIGKLSHLLRYMLYETQDEKVLLENEIDYLRDFIDLQNMRFGQDVTVNFTVAGEPGETTVAPMMFVTLVENAFKHGVTPSKHTNIDIDLSVDNSRIKLRVANEIVRNRHHRQLDLEKNSGGLGLDNLKRRLTLLYPDSHQLTIEEIDNRYITQLELL